MTLRESHRRDFLHTSVRGLAAGVLAPYWFSTAKAEEVSDKRDCPRLGAIGVGGRGTDIANLALPFADIVAICDVDREHADRARSKLTDNKADVFEDYRHVLDRQDIDVVTIGTRDHWHAKIAIEAMQAGKDVYCEKPMTLTIEEGRQIAQVVKQTGCVMQVGTQQRSGEYGGQFLTAVAMVREGRIGKVRRVTIGLSRPPQGGPFATRSIPSQLNWDMWLGQAPQVDYCPERCGAGARWWYEYAGGQLTNWGSHHVDIAQWAIGMEQSGPTAIAGSATHPNVPNGYNTATAFHIQCQFPNGVEIVIGDGFDHGILFEGDAGRFFVNRGKITGKPVEQLREQPLPEDAISQLYRGRRPGSHMRNFFDCVRAREQPISDVFTHHRTLTTMHLANICIRLGRSLVWDPDTEQILGDDEANSMQSREQRRGYEVVV